MKDGGPSSLVYIQARASYPKKDLVSDDPSLLIPFPELSGENVEYLGKCADMTLAISNFRFFALLQHAFVNIPLMLIENLEWKGKELPEIFLWCKNGQSFQLKFDNSEECNRWYDRLRKKCTATQGRLEEIFSFAFHAWSLDTPESPQSDTGTLTCLSPREDMQCDFLNEYRRMGFDADCAWKITEINSKFELCPSYPKLHIIPNHISDEELRKVAKFRTSRRFPSAVWRNQKTGAVIVRCSQPEVGIMYWRCAEDENFLQTLGSGALVSSCPGNFSHPTNGEGLVSNGDDNYYEDADDVSSSTDASGLSERQSTVQSANDRGDKKVLVIDCRSYTAAFANRAKGGGSECTEYYPNCKIQFMGLANIHSIRKSFQTLRELCCKQEEQTGWLTSMEATKWLFNLSMLIKTSLVLVKAVEQEKQHVVVHCSDGWDRTTQVVALAELLLDPFYRTIKGFRVLLEREWLAFGHKFADRCGHGCQSDDTNERCPVFLQWLDCIHQLLRQFPCSFEFNETFLVKLAHHAYSCLFGTFLCNTEQERLESSVRHRTCSVWSLLDSQSRNFRNFVYSPADGKVLYPEYQVRNLLLWSSLYLSTPVVCFDMSSTNTSDAGLSGQLELPSEHAHTPRDFRPTTQRRNSDGDVKSLVTNSGEHFVSGSGIRDDSDLYLTKSLSCKSCTDAGKMAAGKGVIPNGINQNARPFGGKSGKSVEGISPDESEDVFEEDGKNGARTSDLSDTLTSSSQTLVEESSSAKSILGNGASASGTGENSENYSENNCENNCECISSTKRSSETNLKSDTGNENLKHLNGNCGDFNESDQRMSRVRRSYANGCVAEDPAKVTRVFRSSSDDNGSDCESLSVSASDSPYSEIRRYLDADGLTIIVDPVQTRLQELERNYRRQIDELQTQLQAQGCFCVPRSRLSSKQEMVSSVDPSCDGPQSLSSNATTDTCGSWEQVDEDDVSPVLWVPDHLAVSCGSCDVKFTLINRKHHCRSCGNVFCSSCCSDLAPVPLEQHYDPVRVCKSCFQKLQVRNLHDITVAAS